jgi:hypothetical protein
MPTPDSRASSRAADASLPSACCSSCRACENASELALALASEPLRDLVARGGELVQRQRIEAVELLLKAHAASLVSF